MRRPVSTRKSPDMVRIGEAVSQPGIDPSSWANIARVDDDPDAITWDEEIGWIVDVTFQGGKLDQEGPVPCRVSAPFAAKMELESNPIAQGCEVLVVLPGGDANESPMIVGQMSNSGDCPVPLAFRAQGTESAPTPITESLMLDTHVLITEHSKRQQVGAYWRCDATDAAGLHAEGVTLADPNATQAYVRGDEFGEALGAFCDGVNTMTELAVTAFAELEKLAVGPIAPLKLFTKAVGDALAGFGGWTGLPGPPDPSVTITPVPFSASTAGRLKATIAVAPAGWLSARIKGE